MNNSSKRNLFFPNRHRQYKSTFFLKLSYVSRYKLSSQIQFSFSIDHSFKHFFLPKFIKGMIFTGSEINSSEW